MPDFKDLGVAKWLCEALTSMKITTPTAIQTACIPKILAGK
jgi:ATP-dependent RNA helicase DDX49/DBP8